MLILSVILFSILGCTSPQEEGSIQPQSEKSSEATPSATAPASPIAVEVSFPDGAPPLNCEAELNCIVEARSLSIKDMSVEIRLPEALELVSGNLSWVGDIAKGEQSEVISAVVRAVQTGNWTIEVHKSLDPKEHGGIGGNFSHPIYISISEDSAEWGITPPWYQKGGVEVPVKRVD